MRCAATIDIGSTAVRLQIARVRRDGSLRTMVRERAPMRLGAEVFAHGVLSDVTVERLLGVVRGFASECDAWGAPRRIIATAALRHAANRAEVAARAAALGLPFELLSGEEEARLACLGATHGARAGQRALCIDLGGGSTELGLAVGGVPVERLSLELGSARLAALAPGDFAKQRGIAESIAAALPERPSWPDRALASSGTLRALLEFAAEEGSPSVGRRRLATAPFALAALGPTERRRRFGDRADHLVSAALILDAVARRLRLEEVAPVRRGLRDGVLLELSRELAARSAAPLRLGQSI